ncbi:hypothetical protein PpBr36_03887 [Pyricularia pennisetigena]|nr:hypothetical protein PpBr36_03887 [Pyricularia pennisetigena]TLS29976.1 hypothetical protein PpBr36_03887 [Pyricularia pennisetigena]
MLERAGSGYGHFKRVYHNGSIMRGKNMKLWLSTGVI